MKELIEGSCNHLRLEGKSSQPSLQQPMKYLSSKNAEGWCHIAELHGKIQSEQVEHNCI